VADLDAAPLPARTPVSAEPAAPPEPEPARRRSTVRERAPLGGGENVPAAPPPSPAAEPVVTASSEASEGEGPRRTGWWSRRFAGG
jgi:ribonuclease E